MDHWVKNPPTMQEIRFQGGEDRLEEGIATHSSVLAWEISQTEETGGLQCMGSQRVSHDWNDWVCTHIKELNGKQSVLCKETILCLKEQKKRITAHWHYYIKQQISMSFFFVCLNKLWMANKHTNIFSLTKQKKTHQLKKQTHGCQEEGIVKSFGKVMYTLLYFKSITT